MRQQLHDIVRIKFRLMFDGILTHDLSQICAGQFKPWAE